MPLDVTRAAPSPDPSRRAFVRAATAGMGSAVLAACGGGGGATPAPAPAGGVAAAPTPGTASAPAPSTGTSGPVTPPAGPPVATPAPVNPPPAAALPALMGRSTGAMQFTLLSPYSLSPAPFTIGHAFRQGDVPAGRTVGTDLTTLQVVPRNRWPDGSLKFAILSGRLALEGGVPRTVPLNVIAAPSALPTPLGTEQLRQTGAAVDFGAGVWGSARFADQDWLSPAFTVLTGAEMSSWVYRKPFTAAGVADAHLVAWLEVRLYADGKIDLLSWVENGYLRVPAPSNRAATYTLALNGGTVFSQALDLKHHQRVMLLSGEGNCHGLPFDARVTVHHDAQYLQATELVPSYRVRLEPTAPAVQRLPRSTVPLAAAGFVYDGDAMASTGYQSPIGLLPEHDVCYLVSDATLAAQAVARNGFAAGRYGIHYRDELSQRPLKFSEHPTYTIRTGQGFKDSGGGSNFTPVASGGNPPGWDVAHSPSVGYLAHLVTGWRWFLEEAQFATTANFLGNDKDIRGGTQALVRTAVQAWQTRACAWDWRARVQALCITPDDDPLRGELLASVEATIAFFHSTYIAQANNPWGWIKPGEDAYDGTLRLGAPWQQDFVTAAFGHAQALGLPLSSTAANRLAAFFQWKARSAVMRLGANGDFWYINAAPYTQVISPVAAPNYDTGAGPWYATAREVYDATYAKPPAWLGTTEGQLAAEFFPGENSQWGNLQPALAYAVRFGVPGAKEAEQRMVRAQNWPSLRDAFLSRPVWSVVAPMADPAWLVGKASNAWVEIANTAGAGGASVDAYSGMALDERSAEIIIASAGGHNDSGDNRVVSLALTAAAPQWVQRRATSGSTPVNVSHYPDGTPTSRHTYQHTHVVEALDRVFHVGCRSAFGGQALDFPTVDAFNLSTQQWDPKGTWADVPAGAGYGAVRIAETGDIWTTTLARWSPTTRRWSSPITQVQGDGTIRWPIAYDSRRRQLFSLVWGDGQGYGDPRVSAQRIPIAGNTRFAVTLAPSAALTQFMAEQPAYAAMDYDPINDCFAFYSGIGAAAGRIYLVRPNDTNTWTMEVLNLPAGSARPSAGPDNLSGVNNRFRYVAALRGFVLLPRRSSNLFFIRLAV